MAELFSVARPYAKAAFEYAVQHQQLNEWSVALNNLAAVIKDPLMARYLKSPGLAAAAQVSALEKIVTSLTKPMQNFLNFLAQKGRLLALVEVHKLFEQLRAEHEKSVDATVTSAFPLSKEQTQVLAESLKKKLNKAVRITTQLDQSLMGGVFIQAGDLVIDASVRGKLKKLATQLNS